MSNMWKCSYQQMYKINNNACCFQSFFVMLAKLRCFLWDSWFRYHKSPFHKIDKIKIVI